MGRKLGCLPLFADHLREVGAGLGRRHWLFSLLLGHGYHLAAGLGWPREFQEGETLESGAQLLGPDGSTETFE